MLGTEYNWLVSISKPDDDAPPRVRLASSGPLTIAVAVFCFICVSLRAEPAHRRLMNEAIAAAKAGDNVQNGINPQRVVRISLDADGQPAAVKVLGAGHPSMSDLALGQVVHGHVDFVGNAGWALFEKGKGPLSARTVTILRTPLD